MTIIIHNFSSTLTIFCSFGISSHDIFILRRRWRGWLSEPPRPQNSSSFRSILLPGQGSNLESHGSEPCVLPKITPPGNYDEILNNSKQFFGLFQFGLRGQREKTSTRIIQDGPFLYFSTCYTHPVYSKPPKIIWLYCNFTPLQFSYSL